MKIIKQLFNNRHFAEWRLLRLTIIFMQCITIIFIVFAHIL